MNNYNGKLNGFCLTKTFKQVLYFCIILVTTTSFAQTAVGDYRSNVTSGNWATASSWQICTSVSPSVIWGTTTTYPGQSTGSYAVLIQSGNTITIPDTGISTQTMGTVTISGSLVLNGTRSGNTETSFNIKTPSIVVTPLLGTISFINKADLVLPLNSSLLVTKNTSTNYLGLIGTCNKNTIITMGSSVFALCTGSGPYNLTFDNLMTSGGSLTASSSSNSTVCQGSTINLSGSYEGVIGTAVTYRWSIISPAGVETTTNNQSPSISNAVLGTYQATLTCTTTYNGNSYSNNKTISVIVNALPSAPTFATTASTCSVPATCTISNYNSSHTYVFSPAGPTVGASGLVSGMIPGTSYSATSSNGSCASVASNAVVIQDIATNTWSNNAWDSGVPTTEQNLVFASDYSLDADVNGCSCIVSGSKTVVVKSGRTMKIVNDLRVNGTLIFEDTASLVQVNNSATNTGNIIYNRKTTTVLASDYTYWSSPVANHSLNISQSYASGMFYSYDDFASPENWKKEVITNAMQIGKGYIIRGPQTGSQTVPSIYNATFVGTPNNGVKSIAIGPTGTSNLLGNPYPSAIDADLFLSENSAVIEGTIYFWTHNTAAQLATNIAAGKAGSGTFAYTSDDYAAYNNTGGVAALSGGNKPNGKIASGQAFFTTSVATGSRVLFNNTMRVSGTTLLDGTGVNQQFFKKRNSKKESVIENNRIWLNLSNNEGAFKQTLVGYVTNATNGYESGYDGESFDGHEFIDFYSVNQDKNLTIQGRSLPFDENDEVPLGFKAAIAGNFTISIDQVDGSLANQDVFIEDKLTNTTYDLKSGDYSFSTVEGTFDDRFVLRYKDTNFDVNDNSLSAADFDAQSNKVLVSIKNKEIKVNSFSETIDKVVVFDLLGKQVYKKDQVKSNELSIVTLSSSHQALIVKTTLQNGVLVTDKIIY